MGALPPLALALAVALLAAGAGAGKYDFGVFENFDVTADMFRRELAGIRDDGQTVTKAA